MTHHNHLRRAVGRLGITRAFRFVSPVVFAFFGVSSLAFAIVACGGTAGTETIVQTVVVERDVVVEVARDVTVDVVKQIEVERASHCHRGERNRGHQRGRSRQTNRG